MADNHINFAALEPLYKPWEEPNQHRTRAEKVGDPAVIQKGRAPSKITIVNNLRHELDQWRSHDYPGTSDTTRELLNHWFLRDHLLTNGEGVPQEFRYYFCQREAIEAFIYLMEVRRLRTLSALVAEFGGENAEIAALGITETEDLWPRFAFRVATGAGKTKIMSLAIVWSYFHALRESESPMARNFLVIAPNLTVFERLKQDFGDGRVFDTDPLIPSAWRGDWNLSVVLQDEASGAATGGTLYLTNIHRLFEKKSRGRAEKDLYPWAGPAVSRASALDTGEALRKRVTSHPDLMVINDEAHHLWDPDSAWVEALDFLNEAYKQRNGYGLAAQLDFSATPKDNKGNLFKHIVTDSPLGEAVDAGIVKVPIIGHVGKLKERPLDDAGYRYDEHLRLGYARWQKSAEEWKQSGKKPLLFVMCEDTEAADQITRRLNTDPTFEDLNGKTINLHTNLKGKLKKYERWGQEFYEFVEDEKQISDEDLKQLRKLSRELDDNTSPYRCIVSVMMLREGWDVRNVTTIVPLRPYSSKANILPEQTLGRGLRRMTPSGQALETVTVVEHPAFVRLYQDELEQESAFLPDIPVEFVPRTTVSIFPDPKKDWDKLKIAYPALTDAYRVVSTLDAISIDEVKAALNKFSKLKLGQPREVELDYEGRSLVTNEVIENMKIRLPLLKNGIGAISYYREELENICHIRNTHTILAPVLETFLTELLFDQKVDLFDPRLVARLGDSDVREYVRAVFVPIINSKTKLKQERLPLGQEILLSTWRPYQVTASQHRPVIQSQKTLFNLIPCNRSLEETFAIFADLAEDVAAFAKNDGPQALRIDYEGSQNRHAFYTPDFFVRTTSGKYFLVETKGEMEQEVLSKAKAAVAWCKSASETGIKWEYLFIPQAVFQKFNDTTIETLNGACAPELTRLLQDAERQTLSLPFYQISEVEKQAQREIFIREEDFNLLPENYQRAILEASELFSFLQTKNQSFAPCFTPLLSPLDDAAIRLIFALLKEYVPTSKAEQDRFFMPDYFFVSEVDKKNLMNNAAALKKALVYNSYIMPISLLCFCLEYARKDPPLPVNEIFTAIQREFSRFNKSQLYERLDHIREFRNKHVAHGHIDTKLTVEEARVELKNWISGLSAITKAIREI